MRSYIRRHFFEPFVSDVVVVDLASQAEVLSCLLEITQKSEMDV
jgi:hypothetical protein